LADLLPQVEVRHSLSWHLVAAWECPLCDAQNKSEFVRREIRPEEMEDDEIYGEDGDDREWYVPPATVKCCECDMRFEAIESENENEIDELPSDQNSQPVMVLAHVQDSQKRLDIFFAAALLLNVILCTVLLIWR
jgi:hypothetical protein